MPSNEAVKKFEKLIQYTFSNKALLKRALTHSSCANERRLNKLSNNERLEFLGDAVLELVTSEFIYLNNPDMLEGDMTKLRASFVCEQTLALCAREINLGEYILLGKGEDLTGGRERNSIISDAMEALIGAIYLDGGFANAKEFINQYILADIDTKKIFFDSKTILQEMVQSHSQESLCYTLISEEGPDHNKKFTVKAVVGTKKLAEGIGKTKKAAEQEAAYLAILKLREQNIF